MERINDLSLFIIHALSQQAKLIMHYTGKHLSKFKICFLRHVLKVMS